MDNKGKNLIHSARSRGGEYYSTLLKDMTILTGTMFTTSIALAAGRSVNSYFVFGELFLFISLISAFMLLWHELIREKKLEGDTLVGEEQSEALFKFIPLNYVPLVFFISMIIGMVLIWFSLMK